jgi:hypothetical protein
MSEILPYADDISRLLLAGDSFETLASKLTEIAGFKVYSTNLNPVLKKFFTIHRDGKKGKVLSVKLKNFCLTQRRTKRGLKPHYIFFSEPKKGTCTLPETGQCKFPIGDYPFKLCPHDITSGAYCDKHNEICYKKAV